MFPWQMQPDHMRKAILTEADDDYHNVKSFLHGACHVFALALHKRFKHYSIVILEIVENGGLHIYCRFGEGKSVDVVGIASESRALRELDWSGQNQEVSADDLKRNQRLCFHPCFLKIMEQRAERRIEKFKDYYSGARGTDNDILGAKRIDRASDREINGLLGLGNDQAG